MANGMNIEWSQIMPRYFDVAIKTYEVFLNDKELGNVVILKLPIVSNYCMLINSTMHILNAITSH